MLKYFSLLVLAIFMLESINFIIFQKHNLLYKLHEEIQTIKYNHSKINSKQFRKNASRIEYSPNYKYMVNNNIAQYSSYIIIGEDDLNNLTYRVVTFIHYNFKNVKDFGKKENFLCLLKSTTNEKIIEIEAFHKPIMYDKEAGKLIFKLNNSKENIGVNKLVIAVIWKPDYNKSLDLNEFINKFDETDSKERVVFPFDFIKYQIPTIIHSINQRLPFVGLCVHFTYKIHVDIINWIDNNLMFGIHKIMFYDGTNEGELTTKIRNHYGENKKLIVRPYNMTFDSLCHPNSLLKQFEFLNLNDKIKKYLINSCSGLFNKSFINSFSFRSIHEQITVNDCFTVLKEQYEFIAYFDLDEFIFPRNYKNYYDFYEKNVSYSCDNVDKICPLKVFSNSFETERSEGTYNNYFYNYLMQIIKKENKENDRMSEMGSLYFQDSPFFIPNIDENILIENLRSIASTNLEILSFPLTFNLGFHNLRLGKVSTTVSHFFRIEREDISYVKYLYNTYNSFISCVYSRYLNKSTKINSNLVRYFYYTAEPEERPTKSVHYYKNINTIFIHRPLDYDESAWNIQVPYAMGHLSHFRHSMSRLFKWNSTGSIKKLNLDFEYVIFLLKNFTSVCDNYF